MRRRGGNRVLLHGGANELIEVKEQLSPEIRFVIWGEYERFHVGVVDIRHKDAQQRGSGGGEERRSHWQPTLPPLACILWLGLAVYGLLNAIELFTTSVGL